MRLIGMFAAIVVCAAAGTPAAAAYIQLHEPGRVYEALADEKAPRERLQREKWRSAALEGSTLRITRIRNTRVSDWLQAKGNSDLDPARLSRASFKSSGPTFEQPRNALFAFRIEQDSNQSTTGPIEPGAYPSHVAVPQMLRPGWRARLRLGKTDWTLWAEYERRADGGLLPGSMRLMAEPAGGGTALILTQPDRTVFSSQELLWLGDLDGDGVPDLVLKSTLATGEIQYVLAVGPASGVLRIDPDRPQELLSDPGSVTVTRHRSDTTPMPTGRFGVSAFSISADAWEEAVEKGAAMKPRTIGDRQLMLADETLRFTLEYVPLAHPDPAVSAEYSEVHGDVFVKVHYRGRSQVLVQASGSFRLQVGTLQGQPAIQIQHGSDHGGFTQYWILDQAQRFRRLLGDISTGC